MNSQKNPVFRGPLHIIHMYPDIYSPKEISAIESLFVRFRSVISDDDSLYGFTLSEFDEVVDKYPNIDLLDEDVTGHDHSKLVLNNMFAFLIADNPVKVLADNERFFIENLWKKLENS